MAPERARRVPWERGVWSAACACSSRLEEPPPPIHSAAQSICVCAYAFNFGRLLENIWMVLGETGGCSLQVNLKTANHVSTLNAKLVSLIKRAPVLYKHIPKPFDKY